MRGDTVTIKCDLIKQYRRTHALSKAEFYAKCRIHFITGSNMLRGETVSLVTAKKVAAVLGIKVQELIQSWND